MKQSKEGDLVDQYFDNKPIKTKKMQAIEYPLGKQEFTVMVGKLKGQDSLVIQANDRYVEIPMEHLKDTILAMTTCIPSEE